MRNTNIETTVPIPPWVIPDMTDLHEPWVPGGTHTQRSRRDADSLTTSKFERTWPQVERRLLGLLRKMNVPADRGQDFVQEAAIRVLQTGVTYSNAADLYPWAAVVVKRLAIDDWRRDQHLATDARLVDRASATDVAHEVDRRLALEAVLNAWPSLSERDRRALILAVEERAVAVEQAEAQHAARYRARVKLRAATRGVLAWVGLLSARRVWKPAPAAVAPIALAAVMLPILLTPATPAAPPVRRLEVESTSPRAESTFVGLPPDGVSRAAAGSADTSTRETSGSAHATRTRRPDRADRPVNRLEVVGPTKNSTFIEHDPAGTGPLLCAQLGPPFGERCTPSIVSTLFPVPDATPGPGETLSIWSP